MVRHMKRENREVALPSNNGGSLQISAQYTRIAIAVDFKRDHTKIEEDVCL